MIQLADQTAFGPVYTQNHSLTYQPLWNQFLTHDMFRLIFPWKSPNIVNRTMRTDINCWIERNYSLQSKIYNFY